MSKLPEEKGLKKAFGVLMGRLQATIERHKKRRETLSEERTAAWSKMDELRERAERVRHLNEVWNRLSELIAYYEDPEESDRLREV